MLAAVTIIATVNAGFSAFEPFTASPTEISSRLRSEVLRTELSHEGGIPTINRLSNTTTKVNSGLDGWAIRKNTSRGTAGPTCIQILEGVPRVHERGMDPADLPTEIPGTPENPGPGKAQLGDQEPSKDEESRSGGSPKDELSRRGELPKDEKSGRGSPSKDRRSGSDGRNRVRFILVQNLLGSLSTHRKCVGEGLELMESVFPQESGRKLLSSKQDLRKGTKLWMKWGVNRLVMRSSDHHASSDRQLPRSEQEWQQAPTHSEYEATRLELIKSASHEEQGRKFRHTKPEQPYRSAEFPMDVGGTGIIKKGRELKCMKQEQPYRSAEFPMDAGEKGFIKNTIPRLFGIPQDITRIASAVTEDSSGQRYTGPSALSDERLLPPDWLIVDYFGSPVGLG